RIAVFSSPFASYGVDGIATFNPGTWLNQACSDCECCAAERRVAPSVVRNTIGTFHVPPDMKGADGVARSEEHTSELQSLAYLVCRLLLEKKKKKQFPINTR